MTLEQAIVISIRKYYENHELSESDTPMVYTNKFFDEQEEILLGEGEKDLTPVKEEEEIVDGV